MRIPKLYEIERELKRRELQRKAIPVEDEFALPEVIAVADRMEGTLRRQFLEAVKEVKADFPLQEVIEGIPTLLHGPIIDRYLERAYKETLLEPMTQTLRLAYMKGAKVGAEALRPLGVILRTSPSRWVEKQDAVEIEFDLINQNAVEWAERNAGIRVTEITEAQMLAVSVVVTEATAGQMTVDQTARALREFIGLHSRQVTTLEKYRQSLIEKELPTAEVTRLVNLRAKGMLTRRSRDIARTEIVNSANAGQRELWEEAANQGFIDRDKTQKVWLTTQDDLAEIHCLELHGVAVPLHGQFESAIGTVDGPTLHPNCRCGLKIRFDR